MSEPLAEPYRPPRASFEAAIVVAFDEEADRRRRALLRYEAAYVALGLGGIVVGIGVMTASLLYLPVGVFGRNPLVFFSVAIAGALGALAAWAGARALRMEDAARRPAWLLAALLLVTGPVGIPLAAWLIRLLRAEPAAEVLTPEHRELQARTPHLENRCAIRVMALLAWGGAALISGALLLGVGWLALALW